ncbi:VOC family protein [Nocardia neocaledoniensis]|uniref:VOC family protein n=1 Tax=Nocardia neocaledoniensis TaxID=236511 RepID=UPI00245572CD|nr:VOC family protein [Nocardia neocaledoniensis]
MPIATVRGVTLDCADPRALARFYQDLTGMQVAYDADEYVALSDGSGCELGFQRVDGFRASRWPGQDAPQQVHLDLRVADLDDAEKLAVGFDAVRPDHQPGGDRWRVLLDPAGHPFCVVVD